MFVISTSLRLPVVEPLGGRPCALSVQMIVRPGEVTAEMRT